MVGLFLTVFAGLMMVSNIRFHSFKELNLKGKVPFVTLLVVVMIFVIITIKPAMILFSIMFLYAFSGPVITLVTLRKTRELRRQQHRQAEKNKNQDEGNERDLGSESQSDTNSK